MSEKRKPILTLLARKSGQRKFQKIEIFRASDFTENSWWKKHLHDRFRLRVNGRWFPKENGEKKCLYEKCFTSTTIKNMYWKAIKLS